MPLQVSLSPWFHGVDCTFECIAIIVALLLTFYAYEMYKFSKVREYKFFSLAFLCIAGSFLFKVLSHVSFYNVNVQEVVLGVARLALQNAQQVHIAFLFSAFAWRALFLAGFLLYYVLLDKNRNKRQLFLTLYLAGVVAAFSIYKDIVFYITAAIVLLFIVYILYFNAKEKRAKHVSIVFYAFILLFSAQVTFLFVSLHRMTYLAGQILQLIGFGLLLANYVLLMRRKK